MAGWWEYVVTGYDTNGSSAGCSTYDMNRLRLNGSPAYTYAQAVAVCVQSEGCSSWKFGDGHFEPIGNYPHTSKSYTW
jgi:hypothetical protein